MKIGLDFHSVIDTAPQFFSVITNLLIRNGHEVHIITGEEDTPEFRKHLCELGIAYTHFFSIVTHNKKQGTEVTYDKNGHPWIDEHTWNTSKAKYCREHKIDIHFDDSEEYCKHFGTPYVVFKRVL